jgi:hypothetical protein
MDTITYKIYGVLNPKSNKHYIGKTKHDLLKRKKQHYTAAKRKTNSHKFYDCILAEGDNLVWFLIEDGLTELNVNEREKHYVGVYDSFNNGYNGTLGGDGGDTWSNNKNLENFRELRRLNWLGDKNPNFGKPLDFDQKEKMIKTKTGKPIHSIDYKNQLSDRLKCEWESGKRINNLINYCDNRKNVILSDNHKNKISDGVRNSEKYKNGIKTRSENKRKKYNEKLLVFGEYIKQNKTKQSIMDIMLIKEPTYYKYKKDYESKFNK